MAEACCGGTRISQRGRGQQGLDGGGGVTNAGGTEEEALDRALFPWEGKW